jgi:hypothetical protein
MEHKCVGVVADCGFGGWGSKAAPWIRFHGSESGGSDVSRAPQEVDELIFFLPMGPALFLTRSFTIVTVDIN